MPVLNCCRCHGKGECEVAIEQGEGFCINPPPTRLDTCPECAGSGQTFIEDKTSVEILSVLKEIRNSSQDAMAIFRRIEGILSTTHGRSK